MRLVSSLSVILSHSFAKIISFLKGSGLRRRLVALALVLSLLVLPVHASAFSGAFALASDTLRAALFPVRVLPTWLAGWFNTKKPQARAETLTERANRVSSLRLSPAKYVGYVNQQMTFSALPSDVYGEAVHGARLSWDSSDQTTVSIDDEGRATFLKAGLAWLICRVGVAESRIPVLVRPGSRPLQTDAQWQADQNSLTESGTVTSTGTSGTASLFDTLLNGLAPTAEAQNGGGPLDYLWNDVRNLTGAPPNRIIEATRAGGVLPEGSNFNLNTPLVNLQGRGPSVSLSLAYNSRIWQRNGSSAVYCPLQGYPRAGYYLGFGYIVTYTSSYSPFDTGYLLIDSAGTPHYLGHGSATTSGNYQTQDGTHISFTGSASNGGTLTYNDGTKVTVSIVNNNLLPTQIEDRNGNYIQVAYKDSTQGYSPLAIDYVTDTEGRTVQFTYDTNKNLTAISVPAQGSGTQTVAQFDYQNHLFKYTFSGLSASNAPASGSQVSTLRHVYLPATGTGFLLSYSDYGLVYNVSWRRGMTGPTSDGTESAAVNFNYPTAGTTTLTDSPAFTQRTESATNATTGTFTYSSSTDGVAQTKTYTVTRPDSSTLNLTRSTNASSVANGLLTQSEVKTSGGASMAKSAFTYANDPAGFAQVQSLKTTDDAGNQILQWFEYDQYGNVIVKREYGTAVGGTFTGKRNTRFTYNSSFPSLLTSVIVYDALNNNNDLDDVPIAKTTYSYDDYQAMNGMEGYTGKPLAPGHDSAFTTSVTTRGNVTGMTEWYDLANNLSIAHLKKYDLYGNVVQEQVSCCNVKSYTLSDATNYARPDQVMRGDTSGVHLIESMVHDFNTGLTTSQTDPNSQTTTITYDAVARPAGVTTPSGAGGSWSYNDSALTASKSVTYTDNGVQTTVSTSQETDGWGRVIKQYNIHGGQINTTYDGMGRVSAVSNPFASGGTPGYWTSYQYDALGRVTSVTTPDNNTVQTSYSGLVVTTTDQVGRQTKRTSDGLGRLVTATEQDVSTGNLNQDTTYTYNLLDKLTGVNQGNQTRAWKYDDLGRLTFEKIPEQTATINDGTGTLWTTKYTYTNFSAVATKTDARGVVTTFSYDTLNRVYQVSYDTSGATGVAATAAVTYNYDNVSTSATFGKLLSVQVGSNYQESYAYDSYKRLSSVTRTVDSKSYQTSYGFNQANMAVQLTYPSGYSYYINFDSQGRVQSLSPTAGRGNSSGYVTGITYSVAGQATGMTLGNGVVESYGFDAQRMQVTSQTATKGATTLLSLTYNYSATAGQSGVGTTAGNSGELMSISGTINGLNESASYTYDDLGRLVTSNQTTNGTSAQRRFTYDRWGNRTSVYDATSGGNQIQSVTLQQVNSVPTNRLTSVINSGTTLNYTYDNNGNVTNDGAHTYTYDAENRVVSVDSGTTASYAYDQQNRRIKKTVGSTVTHYVWEGNQVIAEHNGSTGAVIVNYTYLGSRMINKTQGSTTTYFLNDQLSARVVMDNSGNVVGEQSHLSFGEEFGGSGTTDKHHFTNYESDTESGQDYAVNRGLAPGNGKFNQADPYRSSGGAAIPQSWNRYAYTQNDPINYKDSTGLDLLGSGWISNPEFIPPWIGFGGWVWLPGPIDGWHDGDSDSGVVVVYSPCTNDDGTPARLGFNQDVNGDRDYNVEELNHAAVTILGELSSAFKGQATYDEAVAIASIIFNRSVRIRTHQVPDQAGWGNPDDPNDDSLIAVSRNFDGYSRGWGLYNQPLGWQQGEWNCEKFKAAGAALNWLGSDPSARKGYLYMCAKAWLHVGRSNVPRDVDTANGEVQINNNVFSDHPFGDGNLDCHK